MSPIAQTVLLLVCSNVFMTFAWYAHLRDLRASPLLVAVGVSWVPFVIGGPPCVRPNRVPCSRAAPRPPHEPRYSDTGQLVINTTTVGAHNALLGLEELEEKDLRSGKPDTDAPETEPGD